MQLKNESLTPIEETLLRNYVQKAVAEFVFYEALPFLNFPKTTDKAVSKESSEYSQPSTLRDKIPAPVCKRFSGVLLDKNKQVLSDNASKFP